MTGTLELVACSVDLVRGTVSPRGESPRTLTTRELDLLRYLVHHASRPVSRDEVLVHLWGYSDLVVTRACDNAVRRLREKIEADPGRPDHVLTVHGTGYRFEPLVGEASPLGTPSSGSSATPLIEPSQLPPSSGRTLTLGGLTIDLGRRRVHGPEGEDALTDIEVVLLDRLARAEGQVVDRRTLLRDVWGAAQSTSGRRVDNVVRRLRTKIEVEASEPRFLLTARGGGYRLELPAVPVSSPQDQGRLFGREVLVGQVVDAVRGARWVLLLGPGGMGKTRIARRVAALLGTTVWVDLAGMASADEVVTAVARVLGLDLAQPDRDRVGTALHRRRGTVLILDNLEQAVDAAAELIGRWRNLAPDLRILGTSRIRLGVEGEVAIEVGPLGDDDAVELFVERARAASSGFVRPADRSVLLTLVRRLDRMPLAIELAAGRTPVFAPADLLARLDLDLLSRPRSLDPRHRTLRSAIEASWSGLSPEERSALLEVSLFRSGFVFDDAEALLGPDAVDLVQSLRDRSLLHGRSEGDGVRMWTWETIREFAAERRAEDPDRADRIRRHCAYLGRFGADSWLRALDDRDSARIDGQIARVDDFADAVGLALGIGELELAVRCCGAAAWVYALKGPAAPVIALCDAVLAASGLPEGWRARLLLWRATGQRNLDLTAQAERSVTLALASCDPDDPVLACQILQIAGQVASDRRQLALAHDRYLQAAAEAERAGERVVRGLVAWLRAGAARTGGDEVEWERWLRVGVELARDHPRLHGVMVEQLGKCAWRGGRLTEATALLEEAAACYALCRRLMGRSTLYGTRVLVLLDQGDHGMLDRVVAEGLEYARMVGSPVDESLLLAYRGTSLLYRGRIEEARELLAAAGPLLLGHEAWKTRGFIAVRTAELHLNQGDAHSALAIALRAAADFATADDRWGQAVSELSVAEGQALLGIPTAREVADRALATLREVASPIDRTVGVARFGRIAWLLGDRAAASACYDEAVVAVRRMGWGGPGTEVHAAIDALGNLLKSRGPTG